MLQAELKVQVIVSEPFSENTYIAHLEGSDQCVVVDPGFDVDAIVAYLSANHLAPAAILNTHGHADHIAGNGPLKRQWPDCPLVIGAGDAAKLTDPQLNLSAPFGLAVTSPPADETVHDGQVYRAAGLELEVLHLPGHSAGHVAFVCKAHDPWLVLDGDVLFCGSIGRTDFPDGDLAQLKASIRQKLFTLPDTTVLLPGHGPKTTVGREKAINPFVGTSAIDPLQL